MKLLVTGAGGQVGWEIARQLSGTTIQAALFNRQQLDITNPVAVKAVFQAEKPDLLINAAAYTKVDLAETEPEAAFSINREASGLLAECCAFAGIPMIHFSTDYVFDGTKTEPYTESDSVSPVGTYALSKAGGEVLVRERLAQHVILRTSWVYGVHGANFVHTMLRIGKEKSRIGVVADQFGSPTAAADLAATVLLLAERIRNKASFPWGTYHYCGLGVTTWYAFAAAIFKHAVAFGYPYHPEVFPISTAQYPTPAHRPAYSALDCTKIFRNIGIQPIPWQERLSKVLKEILSPS
ncbi:MAG: dTDP-4-dehydrorhamnose reductase [Desulfobacterales bacterium]|jgi:dTDP-4-dehydrorhamnose reductase|nr:dTDP-4-dehydrorhamnose reductase [Desulfobacterales bacterium]